MTEKIAKTDFIELDFTARIKGGELFDTTNKQEAEKANFQTKDIEFKPSIISVGNKMLIEGLEKSLEGKEIGKEYEEEFSSDESFGKRNPQLVKTIPIRIFKEQNIQPQVGMQFNMDGHLVRIISVSGGRVLADFNNPLSGKSVIYKFKAIRKVTDIKEKVNALQDFFFKKRFDFDLDTTKMELTFNVPKAIEDHINLYKKKFKDILGFEVITKELKESKNTDNKKPKNN